MTYRWLDMDRYVRRAHFDYFRGLPNPWLGLTVEVDVTAAAAFCRRRGCSFYLAFTHVAALAANAVPQLRQRVRGEGIVEYERCDTSHVELLENGAYAYCTLRHDMPWPEYLDYAEAARRACREKASIEEDEGVEGLLFITSLPWLRYTQLLQPTGGGDESNPRISWGRFEADARGRLRMPLTLLAHHALVDGLQAAEFYRNIERGVEALERE